MKKLDLFGGMLGMTLGVVVGFYLKNTMMMSLSSGLWTVEEGAPWAAIYIPIILGGVFGLAYGLRGAGYGVAFGFLGPFIASIATYVVCLIIGLFLDGSALSTIFMIILFVGLFSAPASVVVFIFD